jgi:hypothetical protein
LEAENMRHGTWVLLSVLAVLFSCGQPRGEMPVGDEGAARDRLLLTVRVLHYSPDDLHMQLQGERSRPLADEWYDVVLCAIQSPEEYAGQQLRILRRTRPAGDRPLDERFSQAGAVLEVQCSVEGLAASSRVPAEPYVWAVDQSDIKVVAPPAE